MEGGKYWRLKKTVVTDLTRILWVWYHGIHLNQSWILCWTYGHRKVLRLRFFFFHSHRIITFTCWYQNQGRHKKRKHRPLPLCTDVKTSTKFSKSNPTAHKNSDRAPWQGRFIRGTQVWFNKQIQSALGRCVCVYVCVYMCVCMCVYVCMCMCVNVCVYVCV